MGGFRTYILRGAFIGKQAFRVLVPSKSGEFLCCWAFLFLFFGEWLCDQTRGELGRLFLTWFLCGMMIFGSGVGLERVGPLDMEVFWILMATSFDGSSMHQSHMMCLFALSVLAQICFWSSQVLGASHHRRRLILEDGFLRNNFRVWGSEWRGPLGGSSRAAKNSRHFEIRGIQFRQWATRGRGRSGLERHATNAMLFG